MNVRGRLPSAAATAGSLGMAGVCVFFVRKTFKIEQKALVIHLVQLKQTVFSSLKCGYVIGNTVPEETSL